MHRYLVRFIERSGHTAKHMVFAHTKGEARRIAAQDGCEDILKVRRVGLPWTTIIVITLILASFLYIAVR